MSKKRITVNTYEGIGVLGWLGILFVGLKLTGYIDWSWFFVTMPFWIWIAVVLGILVAILATTIFVGALAFLITIFQGSGR